MERKNCPSRENNLTSCPCTYPCEIKGICCLCVRHHRDKGELPACYFSEKAEKTYDRSVEKFMEIHKK